MKVKIGQTIYSTDDEPIMLIFENDDSRKTVARHLSEMPEKEGIRKYAVFDEAIEKKEVEKFMELPSSGSSVVSLIHTIKTPDGLNYAVHDKEPYNVSKKRIVG